MRSWPSPDLPRLSVAGPEVALHDTSTNALVTTRPDGPARMYVCGITPYDATHIGHAATYVAFDLLLRAWRNAGHEVSYVQNVTDVDDPLLERATKVGVDWVELAERETELFRQDMTALRVVPPAHYVGAVESISLVVELIARLQAAGAVYQVEDDLYFSVTSDPAFGEESRMSREEMLRLFPERGGDPERAGKKDPLDCVVWRGERPGEPAWESPFGRGRPGWHIECTAIALDLLGETFDVQAGGTDLIFPHHEMCANEAQVATGRPFAQVYAHAGMVGLDGEKMSKSRGNLVFVSELRRSEVDPDGDPADVAASSLPLRLGVGRRRALGGRRHLGRVAPRVRAARRRAVRPRGHRGARRDGRRPRRPPRLRRGGRLGEGDARRQRDGRRERSRRRRRGQASSTPPSASSDFRSRGSWLGVAGRVLAGQASGALWSSPWRSESPGATSPLGRASLARPERRLRTARVRPPWIRWALATA